MSRRLKLLGRSTGGRQSKYEPRCVCTLWFLGLPETVAGFLPSYGCKTGVGSVSTNSLYSHGKSLRCTSCRQDDP